MENYITYLHCKTIAVDDQLMENYSTYLDCKTIAADDDYIRIAIPLKLKYQIKLDVDEIETKFNNMTTEGQH